MVNLRINWTFYTGKVRNLEEIRRNTPRNATRANVIQGMDLVYSQTKSRVDSQRPPAKPYRVGGVKKHEKYSQE